MTPFRDHNVADALQKKERLFAEAGATTKFDGSPQGAKMLDERPTRKWSASTTPSLSSGNGFRGCDVS